MPKLSTKEKLAVVNHIMISTGCLYKEAVEEYIKMNQKKRKRIATEVLNEGN